MSEVNIVPVPVKLVGEDGNAYSVMGRVTASMKRNGQGHNVDAFREEATSGDYNHLLQTCLRYAYEAPSDTLAQPEDGEEFATCEECGHDSESTPIYVINDRRFSDEWMCESCYYDAYTCSECGNDTDEYGECEACNAYTCEWCLDSDYSHPINIEWRDYFQAELCDTCYREGIEEEEEDENE